VRFLSSASLAPAGLGGVATTSEIAKALGMPAGNVSRALARLVAAGRVRRLPREGHRVPYQWVGDEGSDGETEHRE
jgi:DNA-binding MarR family transcriptional regulator